MSPWSGTRTFTGLIKKAVIVINITSGREIDEMKIDVTSNARYIARNYSNCSKSFAPRPVGGYSGMRNAARIIIVEVVFLVSRNGKSSMAIPLDENPAVN